MPSAPTMDYRAPEETMCSFLAATLPKLKDHESFESLDLARRLIELYDGPKREHSITHVADTLPWLYQVGLIDYERRMSAKGGARLFLWRKADPPEIHAVLGARPDVSRGQKPPSPAALTSVVQAPSSEPKPTKTPKKKKKKKKKKCCSDPHVVKSKKTGKRRCKNCGTKYKPKKPKQDKA